MALARVLPILLVAIALSVVLFYGGYQVLEGTLKAAELIAFLFLLFAVMQPITAVLSIPAFKSSSTFSFESASA